MSVIITEELSSVPSTVELPAVVDLHLLLQSDLASENAVVEFELDRTQEIRFVRGGHLTTSLRFTDAVSAAGTEIWHRVQLERAGPAISDFVAVVATVTSAGGFVTDSLCTINTPT